MGRGRDKGTPVERRGRKATGLPRVRAQARGRHAGRVADNPRVTSMDGVRGRAERRGGRVTWYATLVTALGAGAGCSDDPGIAGPAPAGARSEVGMSNNSWITDRPTIPDEYIVTFADSIRDVPGLARQMVGAAGGTLRFTYTTALRGFAARLPKAAVEALQRNPRIARIEEDQQVQETDVQLNPGSWGLDRVDQRSGALDNAYAYANAGLGVSVYVLDTGIRTSHAEFGGRAAGAYTAVSDGWGTNDCRGHGTHVAGIVGGERFGIAKKVKLYSVRVLDCNGTGTSSGFIAGVDWVTANRVLPAVANMSLRGALSPSVNAAVQASINAGVTYVVAAGNDGSDACNYSPASTPEALTVAAVANTDGMPGYSNFGRCVDLFAPGSSIRSARSIDDTSSMTMSGTSMATPHVTGVAALVLAANPTATPAQVSAAIVGNATVDAIMNVPAGTANRYLFTGFVGSAAIVPSPPIDPVPTAALNPTDQPPTASFTVTCSKSRCTFDASASHDDRGIASYNWRFGDASGGMSGSALSRVTYAYAATGTYTATLVVTDGASQTSTRSAVVTIRRM
jgi:PKD repeat protein